MRDLIENLLAGDEKLDLYLGIIETVEGIFNRQPRDAWRQVLGGNLDIADAIEKEIADSGLLGLDLSEKHGGMGGGFLGSVLAGDLMAQHGFASFKAMATPFCRRPIIEHGTEDQIRKYVTPTLTGEASFCICATEPTYISGAATADYGFLIAKTEIDTPGALSIFVIDMKSPGIEKQKQNIHIFPNEDQYTLFFDDVELPEDALVGREGHGAHYMFAGLNTESLRYVWA
jgi:acyl-CoA dehydrogenase